MRKFDLSLRSSRSSYFATFRHQLTILSKTDALDRSEERRVGKEGRAIRMMERVQKIEKLIERIDYVLAGFFSSRRRHTKSVSAFLLNRSSDLYCLFTN